MKTKSKLVLGLSILSAATLAAGATSTFAWYASASALSDNKSVSAINVINNTPTTAGEVATVVKYATNGTAVDTLLDSAAGKGFGISQYDATPNAFNNYVTISGHNVLSKAADMITAIIYELDLTSIDSRDAASYDLKVGVTYGGQEASKVKYYIHATTGDTDSALTSALATTPIAFEKKDGTQQKVGTSTAGSNWHVTLAIFVDGTTETAYTASSSIALAFDMVEHTA